MNNRTKVVSILVLASMTARSQEIITVSGKVVDRDSGVPIQDASVYVSNGTAGTYTNGAGEFTFHIGTAADSIVVSHIGYRPFKGAVIHLRDSHTVIRLRESPAALSEVVIQDTLLSGRQIVERSAKAVATVFPATPVILNGFHRSWELVRFADGSMHPGTLIEAAVQIYDPGYRMGKQESKLTEEFHLEEVRRSNLSEGWGYNSNWLDVLLRENLVKYKKNKIWVVLRSFFDLSNDIDYELIGSGWLGNEPLYNIRISVPNERATPAVYTLYVSQIDFAVLQFELTGGRKDYNPKHSWNLERIHYKYMFRRIDGIPYLSHATVNYVINKIDVAGGTIERSEEYFRELMVNKVSIDGADEIRKSWKREKGNSIAMSERPYNENFWKTYNVMMDSPLDKEIQALFEKSERLEEQFSKKSTKAKIQRP